MSVPIPFPTIVVQFKTGEELDGVVLAASIKSIGDAINSARGNYKALEQLHRLFSESKWIASDLMAQCYKNRP